MSSRGIKILSMINLYPNSSTTDYSNDPRSQPGKVTNAFQGIEFDSDDSLQDPNFVPETDDDDDSCNDGIQNKKRSNEDTVIENSLAKNKTQLGEEQVPEKNSAKRVKGDTRKAREERKTKRNAGKEYTTRRNKLVAAKEMRNLKACRNKCLEKFDDETRLILFNDFWILGDYNKRLQYITGLIQLQPKKSTRIRTSDVKKRRERTDSAQYYFSINAVLHRTCKECFIKTFDVSKKFIETVITKKKNKLSGTIQGDQRGCHTHRKKVPIENKELVRKHILAIPLYESHYTRKRSSKKYLPSYYTLANLYQSYKMKYPENYVNRKLFEEIFYSLDIKIKQPKKDTCGTCDKLQMKIKMAKSEEEKQTAHDELNTHHIIADEGYNSKSRDKALTKTDPTKKTICFDLQQCLPTPDLQSGESFYKRLLWTYDLTVHDCDESQAYCYLWYESLAKRGGNEIGSCLYKYLSKYLDPLVTHVTMYSDSCGGQNKNSFIAAVCLVSLQNMENLTVIDHKFLLPGHTHMECDTDHSLIEKQRKRSQLKIEHPHDWAQLIREVGKKKPFICHEMVSSDFLDFSSLFNTSLTNRKQYLGEKLNWREVRWLRYEKNNNKTILYKTSLNEGESFKTISFERRGKPNAVLTPKMAYERPVPISNEKKQHLTELLPYISESLRDFYKNLPSIADQVDVYPDASSDEDD